MSSTQAHWLALWERSGSLWSHWAEERLRAAVWSDLEAEFGPANRPAEDETEVEVPEVPLAEYLEAQETACEAAAE